MAQTSWWDDARREWSRRRMPARRGCFIGERFVRSHVGTGVHDAVEHALLKLRLRRRRPSDLRLLHAMHPLVRAIIVWTRGCNAPMGNTQVQPPRVKANQYCFFVRQIGAAGALRVNTVFA